VPRSQLDDLPRRSKADPKALKMAKQVIEGLAAEWNPKQYHDTYTETLRERIARKKSGKQVVEATDEAPTAKVVDLMAALEASVDAAKKGRSRRSKSARTKPATRRSA